MAGRAAMAAGMWWRHWTTARRPAIGGGWARGACALSVLHSLLTVPVILFASWNWRATVIAFTCAVIAAGVREAAAVSAPMGRVAAPAPDWVARIGEATGGRGADITLDAVSGDIGAQAPPRATGPPGRTPSRAARPHPRRRPRHRLRQARRAAASRRRASPGVRDAGRLLPRVHAALPLHRAAEAHAALEARGSVGSLLLRPRRTNPFQPTSDHGHCPSGLVDRSPPETPQITAALALPDTTDHPAVQTPERTDSINPATDQPSSTACTPIRSNEPRQIV